MVQHAGDDERPEAVLNAPSNAQLVRIVWGTSLAQHCQEEQQYTQVGDVAPRLQITRVNLALAKNVDSRRNEFLISVH